MTEIKHDEAKGDPLEPSVSRLAQREAREPRPAMILRLLAEAQAGVKCECNT